MIDIKGPWKSVRDTERWTALGASFVAKAKATKVVWFPPEPVEAGKEAAATATKATKKTTKKTAGAAKEATKKTAGAGKKATKKTTGAAKKATKSTKSVTAAVRPKKTGS
jgi:hypothetical protein